MTEKKIKPSDLEKIAEQMIADRTMPPLEKVLQAVGEVRRKYRPLIEAVRKANGKKPESRVPGARTIAGRTGTIDS